MTWVTRENGNVDRVACPWLIRRFIDPNAIFLFAPPDEVMDVAAREQAIPYDVKDVELGHVDGRCSFESILKKYDVSDPALLLLGRIVHGADIPADLALEPEAAGLRAIAYGFAITQGTNDQEKIRLETPVYDALYTWCQRRVTQER